MKKYKIIRVCNVAVFFNNFYTKQFNFFSNYFEILGVMSYDEKHFNEFKESEGTRMIPIRIERTISIGKDLVSLISLWFLFLKERPKIVHSHLPKAGLLSMIAAFFSLVPNRIHSVEGMPLMGVDGVKKKILFLTEKITYLFANRIICNSHGLRDFIVSQKLCDKDKIIVFKDGSSTGVDYEFYNPDNAIFNDYNRLDFRKKLGIDDDDVVFFFVGRIGVDKGFNELYNVFSEIYKNRKPKILLAGIFEDKVGKLSNERIDQIKTHPNIIYVGRVPDLRPYFKASDVFIFPSYREGFPNAVLEAGAMGLPCIVTNINGCNEIIIDNYNGLIIEPKDTISLKQAMLTMIENKIFRDEMAKNIRPSIVKRYTRKDLWNELLNEYFIMLKLK